MSNQQKKGGAVGAEKPADKKPDDKKKDEKEDDLLKEELVSHSATFLT